MNLLDEIKRLRELAEKATPGEWVSVETNESCPLPCGAAIAVHQKSEPWKSIGKICEIVAQGDGKYDPEVTMANSKLMAVSRTAIPALCDALEKSITALTEYRDAYYGCGCCDPDASAETARAQLEEWGIE